MIPDWEWHNLDDNTIRTLDTLDDLRTNHPILWAIILASGPMPSLTLASRLGMPHSAVLYELRHYKQHRGLVHDSESDRGIVWTLADDDHYIHLQHWVRNLRRQNKANLDSGDES